MDWRRDVTNVTNVTNVTRLHVPVFFPPSCRSTPLTALAADALKHSEDSLLVWHLLPQLLADWGSQAPTSIRLGLLCLEAAPRPPSRARPSHPFPVPRSPHLALLRCPASGAGSIRPYNQSENQASSTRSKVTV